MEAAVGRVGGRVGQLLIVEGASGAGKTTLLRVLAGKAQENGIRVAWARGDKFEVGFRYGVVRQLFESVLVETPMEDDSSPFRAGAAKLAAPLFDYSTGCLPSHDGVQNQQLLHGLYWTCVNLSRERPLAIVVDDLRWIDGPSLRFLHYLAGRLEDHAILLAVTTGPLDNGPTVASLCAMGYLPSVKVVRPRPLTVAGVRELLSNALATDPEGQLAHYCHDITGGNPFLVSEVISELSAMSTKPPALNPSHLAGFAPQVVRRGVLRWLGRLSPAGIALAEAAAVLGAQPDLGQAAAMAELDETSAEAAVSSLVEIGILGRDATPRFAVPLLRDVIYQSLPVPRCQRLHAAAAHVLETAGATATTVANQILHVPPASDDHAVEVLRKAGAAAVEAGDPESARRYLRRALQEPPAEQELAATLADLGRIELRCRDPRAIGRLYEALELGRDSGLRARIGLELSAALVGAARHEEAVSLLRQLRSEVDTAEPDIDPDLAVQINGTLISIAQQTPGLPAQLVRELDGFDRNRHETLHAKQLQKAHRAVAALREGADAAEVMEMAKAATSDGLLAFTDDFGAHASCATAVMFAICGSLVDAERLLDEIVLYATDRRMLLASNAATGLRAWVRNQCGRLAEAEADARTCLRDVGPGKLPGVALPFAIGALAEVLTARDETTAARNLLAEHGYLDSTPKPATFAPLVIARGRLFLATELLEEGVADLLHGCDLIGEWGAPSLSVTPATEAAVALTRLGQLDRAHAIAAKNLEKARKFGAARELAMALRGIALCDGGTAAVARLEEAARLIEQTDARIDHATVLYELGAALRRCGARARARSYLSDAVDLAERCGGVALARRARQESAAIGGRAPACLGDQPPRLTAGERRVAQLAAEGRRNQEIAHLLFVTVKTVEWHLSQTYRKLGIKSRRELRAALRRKDNEESGPATAGAVVATSGSRGLRERRKSLGSC